jgi:hypothetical protein
VSVYADNPAGRLRALLISFKRHSSDKRPVLSAWAAALGVPSTDLPLTALQMPAAVRSDMGSPPQVREVEVIEVIQVINEGLTPPQITIERSLVEEPGQETRGSPLP